MPVMKNFRFSIHSHTSPSDLQVHAWRIDSSPDAPQLNLTDVQPFSMDGTIISKQSPSRPQPHLIGSRTRSHSAQQDHSPTSPLSTQPPTTTQDLPVNGHQTPTNGRLQPRQASQKPWPNDASPSPTPNIHSPFSAISASPSNRRGSDAEGSSPWCGAVGHATLGRSGRMIERLQTDIDRLKRELNAEMLRRQEIEKRDDMNNRTITSLQTERNNLELAKDVDDGAIKRRDRKIEDLKAELEAERSRRVTLEQEKKEAERLRDEAVTREWKEVSEAKEVAKRACSHADVLELSHKQLSTEYRQRTEIFSRDLSRLTDDRDEEKRKVKQLDHVVEKLQHEIERMNSINKEMSTAFGAYQDGTECRIREMEESAKIHELEDIKLREETRRIVGEARWLINMSKTANKLGDYLPMADEELDR